MYPEVEQYIKVRGEAQNAMQEKERELRAEVRAAGYGTPEHEAAYKKINALYPAFEVARNEAWQQLKSSGDPLVRFIAENCKDYQDYAVDVLRALPADLETLDELAEHHGWCHIWGQFRDQAVEAGLFGDAPKTNLARRAVLAWLKDDYDMGRENIRELTRLMDAAIAEAVAEATATNAPTAEAPASV